MKLDNSAPIGVFDSGVGGLTVAHSLLNRLPHEKFIYLGDTARLPYGNKSPEVIREYTQDAVRFLLSHQVKMIVIACNTASAAAAEQIQSSLNIPLIDAIHPSAKVACQTSIKGDIGVLATRATVKMGAYEKAIQSYRPTANVHTQACPLFVPLIEEGFLGEKDNVTRWVIQRYLSELKTKAPWIDTLVLGCTHYPLLFEQITDEARNIFNRPIQVVSSSEAIAQSAEEFLNKNQMLAKYPPAKIARSVHGLERFTCYVTDEARVLDIGKQFLGEHLKKIHVVTI